MKRVVICAVALATMVGCGASPESKKENATAGEAQAATKSLTRVAKAEATTINQTESFTSEIKAYKENDITPAASGVRIATITVDVGDKVRAGQVLATLDPTLYDQQMISVGNLRADYERLKPVYEAGGISKQTLDQAKTALDVQEEIARNIKKNIELISPISGVVTLRNGEAGDLFSNQPILHIAQIDRLKVNVDIPEQFYTKVKVGMPVELALDIYGDETFDGKVSLIYPSLNSQTRTFTVEVTVPNGTDKLRPGMFARSTFNMGEKEAILVSDVAVQKQFGSAENFVYVIKGGKAERRSIKTGRQVGGMIDILSGVAVGEDVAITGFSRLSDGVEVEVK
ncbi:MAG: efflux RND transporter periplasmic adaptor subunit [Rikenellaceae bacterium]